MKNKDSRGRKPKLTEEEVKEILILYRKEKNPIGLIKPVDIHLFVEELYKEGKISNVPSYAFWGKKDRLGGQLLAIANKVSSKAVYTYAGRRVLVPNVTDLINKKYYKKEELLDHLLDMEDNFNKTLKREEALQIQLADIKDKNSTLQAQNKELQELVYRLWAIIDDNPNTEVKERTEYAVNTLTTDTIGFLALDDIGSKKERSSVNSKSKLLNLLK